MARSRHKLTLVGISVLLWAYCGGLIALGRSFMSMEATLILHAIGAPIGSAIAAWIIHRNTEEFGALTVALTFLGTALFLDVFVVAIFIEKSFDMFTSPLGTWIPLALIFLAALFVGRSLRA